MTERSASHITFVVERTYPDADQARVFSAWASPEARATWMDDPDFKSDGSEPQFDFRVGGHGRFGGLSPEGSPYRYDGTFYDIVPDERIVYAYEMYEGGDRSSVSLTTVEFAPYPAGTRLTYTEQGVFLDGIDSPQERQQGVEFILGNLGTYLTEHAD